ncbi:heptosyltransferase I [Thiohalomonas denitrificans]|uniref:Heptosyltransferase I n=1 Tax=Thiohalomonas denitrificans TaxID=415747 RepID=A0A1G5PQL1_9GAMM|nr:heptosyltransferase I [Thiohalomonas denitrificans]
MLRLSAVGDVSHVLPVIRTLQAHWPKTQITWIIGKAEHSLVGDIEGIEFITFDKAKRWSAFAEIRRKLSGRHFDVLLHMQMSLRASLVSLLVKADVRLGFDRRRARDFQWLFTNQRIPYRPRQHVIDSFFGLSEALGINERVMRWDISIPEYARTCSRQAIPDEQPTLVISPCASQAYRNWTAEGYAAVADHAAEHHGMRIIITGGLSSTENRYGEEITTLMRHESLNLVGRTDLKQLFAILQSATLVLAPDNGPAHLANAAGTPVIGLYATTNPERAGPYGSPDLVVSRYAEAVQERYGKPPEQVRWGARVRTPGTMERITPEEVIETLDRAMTQSAEQNTA